MLRSVAHEPDHEPDTENIMSKDWSKELNQLDARLQALKHRLAANTSKEKAARDLLKRRGYCFEWIALPNGDECQLYDEDGRSVSFWSTEAGPVPLAARAAIEGQIALEHLQETREVRS